jgi:hypothetical protein
MTLPIKGACELKDLRRGFGDFCGNLRFGLETPHRHGRSRTISCWSFLTTDIKSEHIPVVRINVWQNRAGQSLCVAFAFAFAFAFCWGALYSNHLQLTTITAISVCGTWVSNLRDLRWSLSSLLISLLFLISLNLVDVEFLLTWKQLVSFLGIIDMLSPPGGRRLPLQYPSVLWNLRTWFTYRSSLVRSSF